MSVLLLFANFFLMISMQFGGLTFAEPGQGYDFYGAPWGGEDNSGVYFEVRLTDVPVEDYYTCRVEMYTVEGRDYSNPAARQPQGGFEIAGYQSGNEINVFSFMDDNGTKLYSVNEAGAPFILPVQTIDADFNWDISGNEFPYRYMFGSTMEEMRLDYTGHDTGISYGIPGFDLYLGYAAAGSPAIIDGKVFPVFIDIEIERTSFHFETSAVVE